MIKKKSVEKSNPECRRSLTDRSELQKFVLHLLQGAMIGIGAVLPGISGGVLSVVFGIYEPIMAFLSNPREALSQYGRLLLPVHYCARNEFFCTFDAAWALYAVYGRRRSSSPACGCSGGAERRRDDGASGKTDHAAFGTTLLGRVSWDHRDCFGGDAGDCAVFCV